MSRKTSQFSRYDFDPIKEEDILIEEFRTAIKKYEANARVTRVMLPAAVLAVGADYIIKTLIYKGAENFYLTRPGIFLGMVALVCFTIFVIFAIRQHNILKDKWVCPRCGQVLPYYLGETIIGTRRYGNKDILDECYNKGVFLGKLDYSPMIIPGRCPNCREKFANED